MQDSNDYTRPLPDNRLNYQPEPKKNNLILITLVSVVIVLLIALIGLMAYNTFKDDPKANEPEKQEMPVEQNAAAQPEAAQPAQPAVIENVYDRSAYHFTGTIAGKSVVVDLNKMGDEITGSYYYARYGANSILQLNGTMGPGGNISLSEMNSNTGEITGYMEGHLSQTGSFTGRFTNSRGSTYRFNLNMK